MTELFAQGEREQENNLTRRRKKLEILRRIAGLPEYLPGGGAFLERILVKLLSHHYRHTFRRDWVLSTPKPHFEDQRNFFFNFAFSGSEEHIGIGPFLRGFFSSEMINEGDSLLEIGCGDGFFTMRFLAEKCSSVDAIDIEQNAIRAAKKDNNARNINWHLLDAVREPFPKDKYDIVVCDGAIGHFSRTDTDELIRKIAKCLGSDGVFTGSESLGKEGSDHLQRFGSLADLNEIFRKHFKHVYLREESYVLKWCGFLRHEAYWRCSNSDGRVAGGLWRDLNTG